LPKALKEMRTSVASIGEPKKIKIGEVVLWFLGDPAQRTTALYFASDQLKERPDREWSLKEQSYILESFQDAAKCPYYQFDAWWALETSPPWLLFRKKADATLWLKLISPEKTS
jgi:hypothetical protein